MTNNNNCESDKLEYEVYDVTIKKDVMHLHSPSKKLELECDKNLLKNDKQNFDDTIF